VNGQELKLLQVTLSLYCRNRDLLLLIIDTLLTKQCLIIITTSSVCDCQRNYGHSSAGTPGTPDVEDDGLW